MHFVTDWQRQSQQNAQCYFPTVSPLPSSVGLHAAITKASLSPGCEFELRKCIPALTTAWQVHHPKQQEIGQLHVLYAILHHRIVVVPQQCVFFVLKRIRVAMGFPLYLTKGSRFIFNHTCKRALQRCILFAKPRCLCQAYIFISGITWCSNKALLIHTWTKVYSNAISLPC